MTTGSSNNSFVEDGKLYIVPTLTSDVIGSAAIFDGYTYNITGCTNTNSECRSRRRTVLRLICSQRLHAAPCRIKRHTPSSTQS